MPVQIFDGELAHAPGMGRDLFHHAGAPFPQHLEHGIRVLDPNEMPAGGDRSRLAREEDLAPAVVDGPVLLFVDPRDLAAEDVAVVGLRLAHVGDGKLRRDELPCLCHLHRLDLVHGTPPGLSNARVGGTVAGDYASSLGRQPSSASNRVRYGVRTTGGARRTYCSARARDSPESEARWTRSSSSVGTANSPRVDGSAARSRRRRRASERRARHRFRRARRRRVVRPRARGGPPNPPSGPLRSVRAAPRPPRRSRVGRRRAVPRASAREGRFRRSRA